MKNKKDTTMIIKFPIALVLLLTVICTSATPVYGQAYCALRDPVSQIYELFPQATSYKSVVRTVDEQARRTLKTKLPFDIHFNEFGRHTLYVALKGSRPVGLVHVRSEKGRWGLIEVAWALDFNLTILDFRFQRCRSASRKTIEAEAFRSQLIGKKWHEVEAMLQASRKSEEDPGLSGLNLKTGDQVKIADGVFESYEGEVGSVDERSGKVSVIISLFGRATPVDVGYWQLEKVE